MGERIRGRRGVALRRARLKAEPLCRLCKADGIIRAATVPDHIVALTNGGEDLDENIQCLCEEHHAEKTREDLGYKEIRATGLDGWPVAR